MPDISKAAWVSPYYTKYWKNSEMYVEKGYVIKRRRKLNDTVVEEYPYYRKAGDRWFSVKMSYITFSNYNEDAWVWIPVEPNNKEYYNFDYLFKKEELKMKIYSPVE